MMRLVNGSSIAVTPETCGPALRRFAAGLRRRHVFGQSLGATLRWGLLLAVPVVLVAWLLPSQSGRALWVAAAILLPIVVLAAVGSHWRARKILGALRQSLNDGGDELATLHDELATWLEVDERAATETASPGANGEMVRWLEQDVLARLAPHRSKALAAVAKPRLGRWRWLVPVVLLLLLIWLLAVWFAPPWSGVIGGLPNQAAGNQNGEGGGGKGDVDPNQAPSPGGDTNRDEQPDPQGEPEQNEQPDPDVPDEQQVPRRSEQPNEPAPDSAEIPPLIELPDEQHFVVPEFIGDGPTRRARMHAAELEEQANGNQPQPQGNASGATGSQLPNAKPTPPDFERAAEAAQRARHVPPSERAMVRRFFELLRARAK